MGFHLTLLNVDQDRKSSQVDLAILIQYRDTLLDGYSYKTLARKD